MFIDYTSVFLIVHTILFFKVNKWLAEQSGVMPEQPLSADFLTPRRRRPRVDPTLLDWKKLTGEENVSVINMMTGKKVNITHLYF